MADYSESESQEARQIVDRIFGHEQSEFAIDGSLAIADVEADANEFAEELRLLESFGVDAPAMRLDDELVPVALSMIVGAPWPHSSYLRRWFRRDPFFEEWVYAYLRPLSKDALRDYGLEMIPREQARETFIRRATDFLATRLSAVRNFRHGEPSRWSGVSFIDIAQRLGGAPIKTPGCNFEVSSNSHGLRVFWSGAYRVSPNYFSHPTSPAKGVLQSGTYVFGVDGGAYGNQIQWDKKAKQTLPGTPRVHLNY